MVRRPARPVGHRRQGTRTSRATATGLGGQPARQQRLRRHRLEAARPAQWPAPTKSSNRLAAAIGESTRRDPVHAGGARPQCRRPDDPYPVSVHGAGFGHQRTSTSGRRSCSRSCRRWPMLRDVASDQQTSRRDAVAHHRPGSGPRRFGIQPARPIDQALYDAFGPAPGGAVSSLRPIAITFVLGDHSGAADRSCLARQALLEIGPGPARWCRSRR